MLCARDEFCKLKESFSLSVIKVTFIVTTFLPYSDGIPCLRIDCLSLSDESEGYSEREEKRNSRGDHQRCKSKSSGDQKSTRYITGMERGRRWWRVDISCNRDDVKTEETGLWFYWCNAESRYSKLDNFSICSILFSTAIYSLVIVSITMPNNNTITISISISRFSTHHVVRLLLRFCCRGSNILVGLPILKLTAINKFGFYHRIFNFFLTTGIRRFKCSKNSLRLSITIKL